MRTVLYPSFSQQTGLEAYLLLILIVSLFLTFSEI